MERLKFLKQIDTNIAPDSQIHVVLDKYVTHKHPKVLKGLAKRAHHQPQAGKRDKYEHRKGGGLVRQNVPLQLGGIGNANLYAALFHCLLHRLLPAVWQSRVIDLTARRLNTADGLHPSDDGYQLWFSALQEQAALSQRLATLAAS